MFNFTRFFPLRPVSNELTMIKITWTSMLSNLFLLEQTYQSFDTFHTRPQTAMTKKNLRDWSKKQYVKMCKVCHNS